MEMSHPVNRLNRSEFAAALRKGQGRAMLHTIQYGLDDVKDLVLEACLHNQVYDPQLEPGRGDWLFKMFRDSPYYPEFRTAILNAIENETDFEFIGQLCALTGQIAATGDEDAHQKLKAFVYRNAANPNSEVDWLGVEDLLSIEAAEGVVGLARIFGQRLIENPDDFVDDSILSSERYPEFKLVLNDYSQQEKSVIAYREYLEERNNFFASTPPIDRETRKREVREQFRQEHNLQSILDDAIQEAGQYPGYYMRFGKYATPDELEQVYHALLSAPYDAVRLRLLGVFRRAKLPLVEDILLDWAAGENEALSMASIAALSQVSDARIHCLARMKVESGNLLGADNDVINLFIHNYESGDELLIRNSLDRIQPDAEDAHSLGYSLLDVVAQHENPVLTTLILWVYENTPCADCRSRAVSWLARTHQLPDTLRFECQYDSDEETRALAQGKSNT
jgi:hypothetical protein